MCSMPKITDCQESGELLNPPKYNSNQERQTATAQPTEQYYFAQTAVC